MPFLRAAQIFALNPMVAAIAAGLLVNTTPLHTPPVLSSSVGGLGQAAVPIALFSVGLALHAALAGVHEGSVPKRSILLAASVKVLLLPLLTVLATAAVADDLGTTWRATLILTAAMPSSTMTYVLAEQHDQEGPLASAILVTTTVSLFTIPAAVVLFL